jgi:hypothetical protein
MSELKSDSTDTGDFGTSHMARHDKAWQGVERHGKAWQGHGKAWQGHGKGKA